MRQICDTLLHSAAANWWKVANLDLNAIPHSVLHEQKRKFRAVITELNQHPTWAIKEPRLCLILPLLLDSLRNPICIHVVRNPLEVAQSLKTRNGFPTSWGLALWEAYNIHALRASHTLPRIFVSYNSLIRAPLDTLTGLVRQLTALGVPAIEYPLHTHLSHFVDQSLQRHIVDEEETEERLAPFQRTLWQAMLSGDTPSLDTPLQLPNVTKHHLFDLESTEMSLHHQKTKISDLRDALRKRDAALEHLEQKISILNTKLQEIPILNTKLQEIPILNTKLQDLHADLATRDASIKKITEQQATDAKGIQKRDHKIQALTSTVKARDQKLSCMRRSISWRITAPLRSLNNLLIDHSASNPSQPTKASEPPSPSYPSSVSPDTPLRAPADPIATYIVPTAWWQNHPAAARAIEESGQPVLLLGLPDVDKSYRMTCIAGPPRPLSCSRQRNHTHRNRSIL